MDFDPLLLFTPQPTHVEELILPSLPSFQSQNDETASSNVDYFSDDDSDDLIPLHVHDLPLLQLKPPACVLELFLKMLAPATVRNFDPQEAELEAKSPTTVFAEKKIEKLVGPSLLWLQPVSSRFKNEAQIASIAALGGDLKKKFLSEYNGWLTRLVSSSFGWLNEQEADEIRRMASLRLAENCGRSAQPEFIREIEIDNLSRNILLREPSLTSDNLGLKTWGSSYILGNRLAADKEQKYLKGSVLELGSGTGLVGMVACLLGFPSVLTDLDEILPNLKANVELNNITNAEVDTLDWSNPEGFVERNGHLKFDTIILSDPLYSSKHPAWIVNMMNLFLNEGSGSRVLLQLPIRKSFENERAELWRLIEDNGFVVEEENYETGYDDFGETVFYFKKLIKRS